MIERLLLFYYLVAIILDHAHLACPIWLGWGNRGFRDHMISQPGKFILLPALCVTMAIAIGLSADSTSDYQFYALSVIYMWWNAWHFGSQYFGIATLLGWRAAPRWIRQSIIIGSTMALMLTPVSGPAVLIITEINSLAHWVTDISLTGWRIRIRLWWWLPIILVIGLAGFVWKTVSIDPRFCGIRPVCTVMWSIPALLGFRYGLGVWHFLMSRWVWKLSDPKVRMLFA